LISNKSKNNTFILVTGAHRSGTTWTGTMLSLQPHVYHINEPFAPNGVFSKIGIPQYWYHYLDEPDVEYRDNLNRISQGYYSLLEALSPLDENKKLYIKKIPEKVHLYYQSLQKRLYPNRFTHVLIKDPFMVFSSEWMEEYMDTKNVILIRHPAAFVGSVLKVGWRFNFGNILKQETLMEKYFTDYEQKMKSKSMTHLEETCLLWNCIHHVINEFTENHPDWFFIRHKDLSLQPVKYFKELYNYCGISFEDSIESKILSFTSGDNSIEQKKIHDIKRDSRSNIKNWQNRLTKDQIIAIRKLTEEISHHFYKDEDWE